MAHVGLVFVGLILSVNALVGLGRIPARSAAVLNLMVGALQIMLPTLILSQAGSDIALVNATWPSYLFGMTYLLVGFNTLSGFDPATLGWFSAFVAAIALYKCVLSIGPDPLFAVIWLAWALMWLGLFLSDGLGLRRLGPVQVPVATAWLMLSAGIPSSTIPALFAQNERWSTPPAAGWTALCVLAAAAGFSCWKARSTWRSMQEAA